MLEAFAIAYFIKQIKLVADQKGIKPGKWIAGTVITWIVVEALIIITAFMTLDLSQDDLIMVAIPAILVSAASAYFILEQLKKQPAVKPTEL
ncbi:hypothetical protein JAO71_06915 [Olleya sp. YSTF-M6]|uniref:Uncharacterized protein n=1 Tax=Olleya sediminilitoris TaxID=2795739 RepID=A0ABS1WK86_9FLAO|nr:MULTISPECIES: hypothetical protein [Olleya]MBL7559535.1 hypothetical protein [Olleya sediminilitoris]